MTATKRRLSILTLIMALIFGTALASYLTAGQHGTDANIRMDVISSVR